MKSQLYGKIVSMSSVSSLGQVDHTHYAASKAAIIGMTRSAALELAPYNINVNAIAPGLIETPGSRGSMVGGTYETLLKQIPLGRAGKPEDIANTVAFLVSDDASFITGQCLYVCGGSSVRRLPI